MTPLEMIVYLADKIEPDREDYPGLYEIRRLAETNLMDAVLISLENTASYVKDRGKALHPATIQTINWLRESQKRMSE
jgi:nicotinate-nucleotide adenylyltransferase